MLQLLQSQMDFGCFCILKVWWLIRNGQEMAEAQQRTPTCGIFCGICSVLLTLELTPLDVDDSLDSSDTVSLKAESLSGLSVRGSRKSGVVSVDEVVIELETVMIVELVAPDTVELERLWLRPNRRSPFCSSMLSSPRMASSSASWVSSRLAIENLYEFMRSPGCVCVLGRSLTCGGGWCDGLDTSKPCKLSNKQKTHYCN